MPKFTSSNYPALTVTQYNPKPSAISEAKGPAAIDQLNALITDNYWTVLNVKRFFNCPRLSADKKLTLAVNAFKHALQTFGPYDHQNLPDFRAGVGKTRGHIFHGHVRDANKKEYVIEWAVVDAEKKIMAIVGFGIHENYSFAKEPLTPKMASFIYSNQDNQSILEKVAELKTNAKAKSIRMNSL